MRPMLLLPLCVLCSVAVAGDDDETLRFYLSKSDVAALGEFTSEPIGESSEQGVVRYQADFKLVRLIKGEKAGERAAGGTIRVNCVRFDLSPEERPAQLKQGGKAILFLRRVSNGPGRKPLPSYVTVDPWFAIQPPQAAMADALARLTDPSFPGGSTQQARAVKPKSARSVPTSLEGEWRLLLPAGFEHHVQLNAAEDQRYRLEPSGLNFGGLYEVQTDRLIGSTPKKPDCGRFAWKIQSPYLLTLVEQPRGTGSDYSGAVLFRPSPQGLIKIGE